MLRTVLLCLALTTCITCVSAAQGYSITGRLVSARDGSTVVSGHVSATLMGEDGRMRGSARGGTSTEANRSGDFNLPLPGPGTWRVTASGKGFRAMALDEHGSLFTGVVVTPARPSIQIVFRLAPDATIQGNVVDEAGEPVRTAGQVNLFEKTDELPDQHDSPWRKRATTLTDDLGAYEFDNLAPGQYEIMVQSQPWYATGSPHAALLATQADGAPNSLLDMTYPLTWYPGATEQADAAVITLEGGEERRADLRLSPIPSIHLKIASPGSAGLHVESSVPQIRNVFAGDFGQYQPLRRDQDARGALDLAGLAPGRYEVSFPGTDRRTSLLQIGQNSPRILDLNGAAPMSTVSVLFDAPVGMAAPAVRFIDMETGQSKTLAGDGALPRANAFSEDHFDTASPESRAFRLRSGRDRSSGNPTLDLPAGRYEVQLAGRQGQYLTGMTATGAETSGRIVSIPQGADVALTIQLRSGHGVVSGVAKLEETPDAGALVLLVPATLGDAASLTVTRQCQTSTDGGFTLRDVIPGRYILIAIDHGWGTNWADATNLTRYLSHGLPIELEANSKREETIVPQHP
jgi:hypothetical protein